jgi:hypothetical protein
LLAAPANSFAEPPGLCLKKLSPTRTIAKAFLAVMRQKSRHEKITASETESVEQGE